MANNFVFFLIIVVNFYSHSAIFYCTGSNIIYTAHFAKKTKKKSNR